MHDVRHRLGQREQFAGAALGFGARREWLVHVDGIDAALAQRVFGNGETDFDELDVLGGVDAGLLQQHVERPCVPPPITEMPMVLPLRSAIVLIGESSFTAQ